jgi:hypothetical protein
MNARQSSLLVQEIYPNVARINCGRQTPKILLHTEAHVYPGLAKLDVSAKPKRRIDAVAERRLLYGPLRANHRLGHPGALSRELVAE